jgi:hypothetical protein
LDKTIALVIGLVFPPLLDKGRLQGRSPLAPALFSAASILFGLPPNLPQVLAAA